MTTQLSFGRDNQGFNAYAPAPAKDLQSVTLTSGSNASFTVPSNFPNWIINFSYGGAADIWAAYGSSAAAPAGGTFASTNSELNPASRKVAAGTVINLLNNGSASIDIGVNMYAVA